MKYDIITVVYSYSKEIENTQSFQRNINKFNDLKNVLNILGNALSYAENYAIMNGYKTNGREFTYYDYFNASQNTEKGLYFEKFKASIKNLDNVYGYYINRYRELPLPPSLTKEQIISRLNQYRSSVNALDREIYDKFIDVFLGNN